MIPGYDEWLEPPEDDERPTKEELIELGVIGDDEEWTYTKWRPTIAT